MSERQRPPTIDFDGINAAARSAARDVLCWLLPSGKFSGPEYIALNPRRNDKTLGSFTINVRSGVWCDFATGEKGSDYVSLVAYIRGCSQGDAARELAEWLRVPSKIAGAASGNSFERASSTTARIYNYDDEGPPRFKDELRRHVYKRDDGKPVKIKLKFKSEKFVQLYRVPAGWQTKQPADYCPVPYVTAGIDRFDREYDQVLWPEGEKDVDELHQKLGLLAFTFGGVGDGLPNGIAHELEARDIVILADNDEQGRAHAEKKAAVAHAAGATSIKVVHFPELPLKGDVSDFTARGGTRDDLVARIDAATPWSPPQDDGKAPAEHRSGWRAQLVTAAALQTMTFPPVRYIIPGYISEGATILAGKPKIGKSWLTLDLCVAAASDRFTLGTLKPVQGDVLYLALEDNKRRLKGRMAKILPTAETWPQRLLLVTEWKRADQGGLADIEEWCKSVADPVLIAIDTLEKFRPIQNGKTAAYSADYAAVAGLQKIASKYRVAIVINHHVRKMEADDPFDTVSGTLGLTGAADTILVLKQQAGSVTLYARGRDIEEMETALQFERSSCRWNILGAAADVCISNERAAVINALRAEG
ncbi:MAG: AAA family ATPase, partial [Xanthobacteraceae bacterium]